MVGCEHERDNQIEHSQIEAYQRFMTEVKMRMFAIREMLARLDGLHPQIVLETGNLQLRLCCEGIALACLAAHRNIKGIKKLEDYYQASKIMHELKGLHDQFYPSPVRIGKSDLGWHISEDDTAANSFLSRDGLVKLWNSLGDGLHKGSMKSLASGKRTIATLQPTFELHLRSLEMLLNCHTVRSRNCQQIIICEGLLNEPHLKVRCVLAVGKP